MVQNYHPPAAPKSRSSGGKRINRPRKRDQTLHHHPPPPTPLLPLRAISSAIETRILVPETHRCSAVSDPKLYFGAMRKQYPARVIYLTSLYSFLAQHTQKDKRHTQRELQKHAPPPRQGDNALRHDEMKNQIWAKAYFQQAQRPSIKDQASPQGWRQ